MNKNLHQENTFFNVTEESLRRAEEIESRMDLSSMHLHYHFMWDLVTEIEKDEVVYLEIGCYAGGSASLISSHSKKTKCFSVDIGGQANWNGGGRNIIEIATSNVSLFKNPSSSYRLIEGDSHSGEIINIVEEKIRETGGKVDILFIDGDHTYEGVIQDFLNYSNLVGRGGYIIFDDYMDWMYSAPVKHAVDNIVENMIGEEYEVIGTFEDKFGARGGYVLPGRKNNCFVIKKIEE